MTILFSKVFDTPCSAADFAAQHPDLFTNYWFGTQKHQDGTSLSLAEQLQSRSFPGILNTMADPGFYPAALGPKVLNGGCNLYAWRPPVADAIKYGGGANGDGSPVRPFMSAMLRPNVMVTPGCTVAVRASLPAVPATWPGIYLYDPVTKAEIDLMEHSGGPVTVGGVVQNRVGWARSTFHFAGKVWWTNADDAPRIDLRKPHTYGLDWSNPAVLAWTIDGVEVAHIANPGQTNPMWLVVDMDVAPSAGDPAAGTYPAYMAVNSIIVEG